MCLYKELGALTFSFQSFTIVSIQMAPPTTPKTPSKGSKKIISKQSKGNLSSAKGAGAGGEKKANRRKRKCAFFLLFTYLTPIFRQGNLLDLHLQGAEASSSGHGYFVEGHVNYELVRQ